MKWSTGTYRNIKAILVIVLIMGLLGFASRQQDDRLCRQVSITIDNQANNYFINKEDVMEVITNNGANALTGVRFGQLNLKHLEKRLEDHKYIKEADVFKNLQGDLEVSVTLKQPLARLISGSTPGKYISEDGSLLPASSRYTSRVLLISGPLLKGQKTNSILNTEYGAAMLELLKFISEDPLWSKQIAQIDVDSRGNLTFFTQVSKQVIEFGKPVDMESKFKRMRILYDKILPQKGWNTFSRASVKFKDQIICE